MVIFQKNSCPEYGCYIDENANEIEDTDSIDIIEVEDVADMQSHKETSSNNNTINVRFRLNCL